VCALWSFGDTINCNNCGLMCSNVCGTSRFQACCHNFMKRGISSYVDVSEI
ncbi:hypothetical protein WH47_09622, partial [Habropoda laboriosa]